MKRIYSLMIVLGIIIGAATAGAVDANTLTSGRIVLQAMCSSSLIFIGSYFNQGGKRA